jgi:hypothetical protein
MLIARGVRCHDAFAAVIINPSMSAADLRLRYSLYDACSWYGGLKCAGNRGI